jgi:hypothetical protein
MSVEWR